MTDRRKLETKLQKTIVDAVHALGIWGLRINSGSVRVRGGFLHGAPKGTSDVIGRIPPRARFFALEVKTDDGERTPEQIQFGKDVERDGGFYGVVRSAREAVLLVRTWIVDERGASRRIG